MADSVPPSAPKGPSAPPSQSKRRSNELDTGGKKKAKTKHLSQRVPSKTAEREASRRHLALEKQFSKAQRLRSNEANVVSSAPLEGQDTSTFTPSLQVLRSWSPQEETEQEGPPHSSSSSSSSPASSTGHDPVDTLTSAVPGTSCRDREDRWTAQFQSFMQNAFKQFISSKGRRHSQPQTGPSTAPGSDVSETSSLIGEERSGDWDITDTQMSEDEEVPPEQASASGLFDNALFRSLLIKATTTLNLTSVQEDNTSLPASKETNPLLREKVSQDKHIPCPHVFRTSVEKQWNSLATPPAPNSAERKLFNVDPSFETLLEVPTVDAPLASLFSTSTIPGDMAEALPAEDKRFEFSLRRAHLASAWAIKASSSSSFFARASIMWLRELQTNVPPDMVRVHQTLAKLVAASEYVADATLHSTRYSARSIAASVASRRLLWLKQWKTDLKSKWRLSTSKYSGSQLFGSILDPHVVEGKDKRKALVHPSKKSDRRFQQDFRRQGFRSSSSWDWRQPFRAGQSWDWSRGSRSFPPRQDRTQDRQYSGARGQFHSKRPFRGSSGRPFRRPK